MFRGMYTVHHKAEDIADEHLENCNDEDAKELEGQQCCQKVAEEHNAAPVFEQVTKTPSCLRVPTVPTSG